MMFSDERTGIEKEAALFVAKLKYVDHVPFHVIKYMFYGINVFANKRCEFHLIPPKYEDSQALRQLALLYSPVHDFFKRMGMAMTVESKGVFTLNKRGFVECMLSSKSVMAHFQNIESLPRKENKNGSRVYRGFHHCKAFRYHPLYRIPKRPDELRIWLYLSNDGTSLVDALRNYI